MVKQARKHVTLVDIESKAQEFLNVSFAFCEEESRRYGRSPHSCKHSVPMSALASAVLSAQKSINTFLIIAKVERK